MAFEKGGKSGWALVKCGGACGKSYPISLLINGICRPCRENEIEFKMEPESPEDAKEIRSSITNEAYKEIIQRIARYDAPNAIAREVNKAYHTQLTTLAVKVLENDPQTKSMIVRTRQKFMSSLQEIPIVHKVVRMSRYETLYHEAVDHGDISKAVEVLIEARNEMEGKRIKIKSETKHSLLALIGKVGADGRVAPLEVKQKSLSDGSRNILNRLAVPLKAETVEAVDEE